MGASTHSSHEGKSMAHEEEPLLASPPTQDVAHHVNDYGRFMKLLKWGAIVCLIIGLIWMLLVKAYW
jgi:hypothetical protein